MLLSKQGKRESLSIDARDEGEVRERLGRPTVQYLMSRQRNPERLISASLAPETNAGIQQLYGRH